MTCMCMTHHCIAAGGGGGSSSSGAGEAGDAGIQGDGSAAPAPAPAAPAGGAFRSELMVTDPHCYECKVRYRDPKPSDLVMYLHALKYAVSIRIWRPNDNNWRLSWRLTNLHLFVN